MMLKSKKNSSSNFKKEENNKIGAGGMGKLAVQNSSSKKGICSLAKFYELGSN